MAHTIHRNEFSDSRVSIMRAAPAPGSPRTVAYAAWFGDQALAGTSGAMFLALPR